MKCSDIPDKLILEDLAKFQGKWTMLFGTQFSTWVGSELVERSIFPEGVNYKLALAKMRLLHKRGLVGGCPCGCRGDFEITDWGLKLIGQQRSEEYSGYGETKGSVK